MPQIYFPINLPNVVREPPPNPLDSLVSAVQMMEDRRQKQEDREMQRQLYGLKLQEGQMGLKSSQMDLEKGQMDFEKAKRMNAADESLRKTFADLQRLGTDLPTTLGFMRTEAAKWGPDVAKKYDDQLDAALKDAVASKSPRRIALAHNARYPEDIIAAEEAKLRYIEPERIQVREGEEIHFLDPISKQIISDKTIRGKRKTPTNPLDMTPEEQKAWIDFQAREAAATRKPDIGGGADTGGIPPKAAANIAALQNNAAAYGRLYENKRKNYVGMGIQLAIPEDELDAWVNARMEADPQAKQYLSAARANLKNANEIRKKAGLVELVDVSGEEEQPVAPLPEGKSTRRAELEAAGLVRPQGASTSGESVGSAPMPEPPPIDVTPRKPALTVPGLYTNPGGRFVIPYRTVPGASGSLYLPR